MPMSSSHYLMHCHQRKKAMFLKPFLPSCIVATAGSCNNGGDAATPVPTSCCIIQKLMSNGMPLKIHGQKKLFWNGSLKTAWFWSLRNNHYLPTVNSKILLRFFAASSHFLSLHNFFSYPLKKYIYYIIPTHLTVISEIKNSTHQCDVNNLKARYTAMRTKLMITAAMAAAMIGVGTTAVLA